MSGEQKALACEIGDQAGLRQDGNVGRAAGLRVDDDLLLVVFRRGIFHVSAGGFTEVFENNLNMGFVVAAPGSENREGFALEVNLLEIVEVGPVKLASSPGLYFSSAKAGVAMNRAASAAPKNRFFFTV